MRRAGGIYEGSRALLAPHRAGKSRPSERVAGAAAQQVNPHREVAATYGVQKSGRMSLLTLSGDCRRARLLGYDPRGAYVSAFSPIFLKSRNSLPWTSPRAQPA